MPVAINAHQLGRMLSRTVSHIGSEFVEPLHGIRLEADDTHLYAIASDQHTIAAARYRHQGLDGEPFARSVPAPALRSLRDTREATGLRDHAGEPLRYTPHDFRRMFATEAVTGGLPVHIAARILGHKTLTTTQAYLAVFQDDLVRTYRGFLDRRRAERPQEEYREPTPAEWHDFQQHFELRKVSLGTCGRPYGTPCKHEHACIRCPVLQMDPRQRPRLLEIIQNLRERIREAHANGRLGEVEGLQVSFDAAMAKLNSLKRAPTDGRPHLVDLGMPVFTGSIDTK
ncbi:tyrosine-type recombinase/integrase [Streptomyces sp. NPDC056431]|uniref:tyrosine-type recombinase/integrase n=2 Tax=Streptomyces TaxID=1883 RepID=UPI0036CDF3AF